MIRFACPSCKTVLETADAQVGSVFSCPKCSRKMKIPAVVPAMVASASSPAPTSVSSGQIASLPTPSKVSSVELAPCSETTNHLAAATTPILPQAKPAQSYARNNIGRMSLWKRPFHELREIALATCGQSHRLFRFARQKWHHKSLIKISLDAKLALGRRLVENKVGDEQTRTQIATLDEKLRILKEGKGSTKAPKAEKSRLIMTLADEALAKPAAPPGVEAEYQKAKKAQGDLHALTDKMAILRAGLFPEQAPAWGRVAAGFTVVACLLFTPFLFLRGNNEPPNKEVRTAQNAVEPESKQNSPERRTPAEQTLKKNVADDNPLPTEQMPRKPGSESKLPEQGSLTNSHPSGTSVVFAEGIGRTQDEALKDAFRSAVQRVVGVFVDSETLVKSDAIISDKVLTFSDGAIKKYEELDKTESSGLFRVKIKAAVEGRAVAARLEAAHISTKTVDVKKVAESFSKELQADLDRLAHEFTDKEAKEKALAILQKDLERISKTNLIEAKVVGEPERGAKVGDKVPLKIKVRYEIDRVAFYAAMSKLEKSLLMNASASGEITLLATPDLYIKKDNQSSIKEDMGDNDVILVNSGLAGDVWRSHWNYYIISKRAGELYRKLLCDKPPPRVRLSLIDKGEQVIAVDEFALSNVVTTFRSFTFDPLPLDLASAEWVSQIDARFDKFKTHSGRAETQKRIAETLRNRFPEGIRAHDITPQMIDHSGDVKAENRKSAWNFDVNAFRAKCGSVYANPPFNKRCCFASPFIFNHSWGKELQYTLAAGDERSLLLNLGEVKLIQSAKCEVFP